MVLESSLKRLKKSHGEPPLNDIAEDFAQVDACLRESKRFLDDLRQLSRSGQVQLTPSALKLEAIVRRGRRRASNFALPSGSVRVDIATPLPAVWCNESRLKQVLTNLLRNAALHGCDAERAADRNLGDGGHGSRSGKQVAGRLVGLDLDPRPRQRPGIPAEHRQSIFCPGHRLENTSAPGTGMGLAIVAQTVAQMGGKVWIDAESPGTAFVFSVPAAPAVVMDQAATGLPEPHLFRSQGAQPRAGRARRRLSSPVDRD